MTHVKIEQCHNTYPYTTVAFPIQVHRENRSGNLTGFINTKLSHELTHVTKKKNSTLSKMKTNATVNKVIETMMH